MMILYINLAATMGFHLDHHCTHHLITFPISIRLLVISMHASLVDINSNTNTTTTYCPKNIGEEKQGLV